MTQRLPDFLMIGAMKCGTSTLAAQLGQQAGVFMTTPKEPNFFSDDPVWAQGVGWYSALFDGAAPGDLAGEASTHYTKLPTYPETLPRMQATLTAPPRLIYMIRNPVERAVSHYLHEWSEGNMGADPAAAFAAAPEIVDYGCYARQIAPFVEAYGAQAIHLTSLEQLKSDPGGTFAAVAAHLGLESAVWVTDMPAQNVSSQRMRRLPLQGLLIDNPVARVLRRTLVPKAVRNRIRAARTRQDRPEIPASLRAEMETTFTADRSALAQIFPDHPALGLCYPFAS